MIFKNKKKILIIKHGALGDFILSFGPFAAIRKQHLKDHLYLLTTNTFVNFGNKFAFRAFPTVNCEKKSATVLNSR